MNHAVRISAIGLWVLGMAWTASVHAAEPHLKWSFETQGKIYAPPLLTDLDGDGKLEVVVFASRDKRILCLDGAGELRWDCRIDDGSGDGLQAAPSAIDYDGDGRQEIFFATQGGTVGCVDADGHMIWRTSVNDKIDYSGLVLADIDCDFRIEVVFGADSGRIYCLDDCGMERWHYQGDGPVRGIPAVETDPRAQTARIFAVFGGGAEVCLGPDGSVVWSTTEPSPKKGRFSTPAVGFVDMDFNLDVVSVTEDFQVIVNDSATGAEKWRWAGKSSIDQTNSVALADFDHRNRVDVICADGTGQGGTGHVYRVRDGGKLVWSVDVGGGVVQGPSVADVDGDGHLEILVCSRSKRLICLADNGAEKWSFLSKTEVITTPSIADVDGDGNVEIVFTSKDRSIYCVSVDGAANPDLMAWPMISHDPQLSGNIRTAPFTPPSIGAPANVADLRVTEQQPVHIGDNEITTLLINNSYRPRRLEAVVGISLPSGQWIERRVTHRFEPQQAEPIKIAFPALYTGDYTLVMSLLDVGRGQRISYEEQKLPLELAAEIDVDAALAVLCTNGLFQDMRGEAARADLQPACEAAGAAWKAAVEELRALIAKPEATLAERRAALAKTSTLANDLKHLFARAHAVRETPANAPDFGVVPETTLRKVFKDETALTPFFKGRIEPKPATIALCRNELEAAQVVVVPALKDLKNLRLSVAGDLASEATGGKIPLQDVTINRVGYVPTGTPEYNWFVKKQGEFPDVLFPNAPYDVPAAQDAQPYFVTVKAQSNTPPGDYSGVIRAEADGLPPVEIPLNVHVWNFEIPAKPNFKVSMWMDENSIKAFYNYPDRTPFEVRKRFYQMHLDHRISPIQIFPQDGGNMMEDFDYLMANGQNVFFVPVPGYAPEAERPAAAEKLLATRALIQQKGWDPYALLYSMDEVAVMQRPLIPQMVEMNNWVKTVVPEWPRLETSAPERALVGAVDIWCPTIDNFDPTALYARMLKGDRTWLYTVWGRPGLMIEFPGTDHRLMFWACFKYGAEGFLYWGTTHWDLNCQGEQRWPQKPWITYNRQPGHNGCGYLIYPGPDGTPLSSIRLELVRDGIEDYEYFYLLGQLFKKVGNNAPEELRQQVYGALTVSADVIIDNKTFTDMPRNIFDARKRLAWLIEQMTPLAGK